MIKSFICKIIGHKEILQPYTFKSIDEEWKTIIPCNSICARCNKKIPRALESYELIAMSRGFAIWGERE